MSFAFPWVLLFLPATLLFLRKRPFRPLKVSSLSGWKNAGEPPRVKWLKRLRVLRAAACALLIIAIAGPRIERPVDEEIRQGIAIEMLVDISSSMDRSITSPDGQKTTRMEAAKTVVEAFISSRPDDLIGLITFARYADTLSPLTFGHSALIQLVQEIKIQDRPNEDGTAYGDALSLATAQLHRMNQLQEDAEQPPTVASQTIILLTDGENNCGLHLPREAAGLARQWNIRIYAISLADAGGDEELTDSEKLLEIISEGTGGAFWKIANGEELADAYATIDQLEKSEIKTAMLVHNEFTNIFAAFALPALLLILIDLLLCATLLRVNEEMGS